MSSENLEEKSVEELKKTASALKAMTYILGFVLSLLLVLASYLVIVLDKLGMLGLLLMPFALSPILIMNYKKMKSYEMEIKRRG